MPVAAIPQADLPSAPPSAPAPANRGNIFFAAVVIVLAGLAAYGNSFHVPFLLDDHSSIVENTTIQHGWRAAFNPPAMGETVAGRPVVNLSLAFNYHLGGLSVESYHATNLVIHLFAGLILFGLVRRTLELPSLRGAPGAARYPLAVALGTALLWTVHPLQTESVTYSVQRAEALMSLFYLLSLYCFARGGQSRRSTDWYSLAVLCCLLSALSKEVAVTIPVMVLLYDRTFLAGSFAAAWRRRWPWYLALVATWLPLGLEVWSVGTRGNSAGFGAGLGWWTYARAQFEAVIVYLGLSVWPHPLVLDYGTSLIHHPTSAWPYALAITILLATTAYALWRAPKLGFLGAWFFIILAPSSSVVPVITEPMAEHRLYLPLAALAVLLVFALYSWVGRCAYYLVAALALALGLLTSQRNQDYQSLTTLWRSDVAAVPSNARVHNNLATALGLIGRPLECIQEYELSLGLDPSNAKIENSVAFALAAIGQVGESLRHYHLALALQPDYVEAQVNLGNLLNKTGHVPEAIAEYLLALRGEPDSAELRVLLGRAYNAIGQQPAALSYYQSAIARKPALEEAHAGLGNTWALLSQWADAAREYQIALQLNPQDYFARYSLGEVQIDLGNPAEARREFSEVLREHPDFAPARKELDALPPISDGDSGSALAPK